MKKFVISQKILSDVLKRLGHAAPNKPVLPILEYIKTVVGKSSISFTITDLEMTIHYDVTATNEKEFVVLLPYSDLKKIASVTTGDLTVTVDKGVIKVLHENDIFNLGKEQSIDDYPKVPATPSKNSFTIISDRDFEDALTKASLSVAVGDEKVDALNNICMEVSTGKATIISSDRFTVFVKELPINGGSDEAQTVLIDPRAAKAIVGFIETKVSFTKDNVCFRSGGITIISRGKDSVFPDWRKVVPAEKAFNISVPRLEFTDALHKAMIAEVPYNVVALSISETVMEFDAVDSNTEKSVKTSVPCTSTFPGTINIRMNLLSRCIKQLDSAHIPADCQLKFSIRSAKEIVGLAVEEDKALQLFMMPYNIND